MAPPEKPASQESAPGLAKLRVAIVYNPAAGSFSPAQLARLRDAFARRGAETSCHECDDIRSVADLGRADLVCVSGGDGTARALVCALGEAVEMPVLCIHPAGTINLVAREAGYVRDPEAFVADLERRLVHRCHYTGRIGLQSFLCCASIGPDARIVARVSTRLKARIGRLAYLVAFAGEILRWQRQRFDIRVNGRAAEAEALFVLKGRFYAGPWSLDGSACLSDAGFQLLLLPRARRRDMLRLILAALVMPVFADRRWIRLSARSVEILGPAGHPIQADGDCIAQTPATLSLTDLPLRFR